MKSIAYFFLIIYNKSMEKDGKTVVSAEKPKISYEYQGKTFDDSDMVAYFKHENLIHKLENKLLGEFDEKGKYNIPKELLKDLLALRKKIVKKDKQIYFLSAECGKEVFQFKLEIGVVSKGVSFAQLYFVEKAHNIIGDEKIEIVSPIVFYTDDADIYFEEKIKKVFNILKDDEVEGRMKENETVALALLEKIKFFGKVYEKYLMESRLRDKIYLEKVLRILAQDQNVGPIVLKKYEELIKKYEKVLNPANKNYYRVLKQLLDSILLEEEKNVSKEVALLLQRLRKVYVQANTQTVDSIMVVPKKVEAKVEKMKMPSGVGSINFKSSAPSAKKANAPSKGFSSTYSPQQKPKTEQKTVAAAPVAAKQPAKEEKQPYEQEEKFNQDFNKIYNQYKTSAINPKEILGEFGKNEIDVKVIENDMQQI